jgi:ferric-dicitrate binding protein FerR (iron transport regulator)
MSDSITTLAREKAEQVAETAQEAIGALAQKVQVQTAPKKRRRMWPWLVVVLLGACVVAVWWSKRSEKQFDSDYGTGPDAFGDAVLEEQAAYPGQMRVGTPTG